MTIGFRIQFTRYNLKAAQRRMSVVQHWQADDMRSAFSRAENAVWAMRQTDPSSEFEVLSIACEGCHGVECDGSLLWETQAEMIDRVSPNPA